MPLELPGTDEDTEDNDVEVAVEETASYFSQSEFDSIKALYSSKDLYRNYWEWYKREGII